MLIDNARIKPCSHSVLLLRCVTSTGLLVVGVLVAGGCGDDHPPTYPAGGTVVLADGTPLPGGTIELELVGDASAPNARAKIQPDGRFRLGTYEETDGAADGEHRVLILPPREARGRTWEAEAQRGIRKRVHGSVRIDPKYSRYETSGLRITVSREPSKNRFKFVLE